MLSLHGSGDLSDHCRVCLDQPDEHQTIDMDLMFDAEEQMKYSDCFALCTQIDINMEIGYPYKLCKSCSVDLQMVHDFLRKVRESTTMLSNWFNDMNNLKKASKSSNEFESKITSSPTSEEILHIETVAETNESCPAEELVYNFDEDFEILENDNSNIEENIEYDCPDKEEANYETCDPDSIPEELDDEKLSSVKIEEANTFQGLNYDSKESFVEETGIMLASSNDSLCVEFLDELYESGSETEKMYDSDTSYIEIELENVSMTALDNKRSTIAGKAKTKSINLNSNSHKTGGPPYLCELCGHSSPSKSLLASHRHRKHRKTPYKYNCQKCNKGFDTNYRYQRHLQRLTCETYPEFSCEFCSKVCIGVANYNIHMRFHKKEYPYECQFCEKKFMMATHLNNHVKTKHENQRYLCEFSNCGKLFQTKHALKTHFLSHSRVLPYKCQFCNRMQPTKSRLRFHIKRSHRFDMALDELDAMALKNGD